MNVSDPLVVAVVGYLGVVTSILGQIYVANKAKQIEDDLEARGVSPIPGRQVRSLQSTAHPPDIQTLLKRFSRLEDIRVGLIAFLLICLAFLAYIVFQPGEESDWFPRMHVALIAFLAGCCAALLVLVGLGRNLRTVWTRGVLCAVVVFFGVAYRDLFLDFSHWQPLRPNEKLTNAAWYGFDHKRYNLAIDASEDCVGRFRMEARRTEAGLVGKPEPPVGKVSEDVKQAIFENGLLNDVATCYWIKGRAEQITNDSARAREAYTAAASFAHARTFDPTQDIFWSPSQDAKDRLEDLK